ncbi:RNA 2',3'-cyclic phosphodiesterase [Wenzhouxiangella sp. XN201]|uniref:RNA 2',3'-cyclic phosphodiesterase n=1 Tax=Wenzhouxiangella sp. XN201 TaxID=2710755 RepID=UPI0013C873E1|nr:RNA 2',3'-cyclic phosphodiesterase [Wenzhouxiangella sp. XN201]NEZ05051.1 RNA 2',3'-cyclic phosphodiesterase [Wenzhouxiangella sp. XN201]
MSEADTRRLFLALWPDERIRAEIVARREALGTTDGPRRVPDHNLHLTLLFLGDQPADQMAAIETAVTAVEGRPFACVLDRFGWFPGARVLWLGGEAPAAMQILYSGLFEAVTGLGIRLDRRPLRPHVTLFRKVARRPELPRPEPLTWMVEHFGLVESVPGRPYRVLKSWSLN